MERITTKVKKWGNSLGVILPKKVVNSENIKEGLEVNITIQPKNKMTVKDLFEFAEKNKLPRLKKTTEQIMREVDEELWPE
ncbi:MAG: AbrB/MazE/SpoVT family DNA-binding domain-containing protein [Candidatus Nanoarchaeia archaeon]